MQQISTKIFLGNSHDAIHSKDILKELGVTAILNCAFDLHNNKLSHKDGFEIAQCGLVDGGGNNLYGMVSAITQLASLILKGHVVLVHCHEGRSRSAFVILCFLMAFLNDFDTDEQREIVLNETLSEMMEKSPDINMNSKHMEMIPDLPWAMLRKMRDTAEIRDIFNAETSQQGDKNES